MDVGEVVAALSVTQGVDKGPPAVLAGVRTMTSIVPHADHDPSLIPLKSAGHSGVQTALVDCLNPPSSALSKSLDVWRRELEFDINKTFILDGVEFGFMILDSNCTMPMTFSKNYRSVLVNDCEKVEAQILKEIKLGRYIVVENPPHVISSLGAVPKKGTSKIRVIHDFSRPNGGINQFCFDTSVSYTSIDTALRLIKPGAFLSKIDLSEAYRSVPINPKCYNFTGLHWQFSNSAVTTFLFDARLPFGSAKSCRVFQSLSDAIVRIMWNKGHTVCSYIDDFMVIADTELECESALVCLCNLVQDLGFTINWEKVALPAQKMTFLGIELDCLKRTMSLPEKKLLAVKELLVSWSLKVKCKKHDLQSLIGHLNWCSRVVRGGRTFTRNLINLLDKVKEPYHYVRISKAAKSDIGWWIVGLNKFHGYSPFNVDIPLPSAFFETDACLVGGAGHCGTDWYYVSWELDYPELPRDNINVLELQAVLVAAKRWGHLWTGSHIQVKSDNMASVAAVNNSTSRSPALLKIIKELFWLSVQFNFRLSAKHIPGKFNLFSDKLSRLHDVYDANFALFLLSGGSMYVCNCCNNMSYTVYLSLQRRWKEVLRS